MFILVGLEELRLSCDTHVKSHIYLEEHMLDPKGVGYPLQGLPFSHITLGAEESSREY